MKKIDFATTQKKMFDTIKEQEVCYRMICEVSRIVEQFEGKKIDKRIMTAIKKALPSYAYYWNTAITSSRSIQIWGSDLAFDDSITIYLPFHIGEKGHIYKHAAFIEANQYHFFGAERNERTLQQAPLLKDAVTRYNKLIQEIEEIQSHFTEYPLSSLFIRGGE